MPVHTVRRLTILLATTVLAASASGGFASAAGLDDDARIARLEAAVAALQAQAQAQAGIAAENKALKAEVAQLRDQVRPPSPVRAGAVAAIANAPAPAAVSDAPVIASTYNGGEPGFATADGRFSLNFYSLVQLDAALYGQDTPGPIATDLRRSGPALGYTTANVDSGHARKLKDGDDFRRARIGFGGSAFGNFQFRLIADFGGSGVENAGQLYEGWVQYNGFKPLHLRIGAFAPQEGLADQDSAAAQPFLERPLSGDIARNFAAGDTRTGAQAFAYGDRYLVSVAMTGRTVGVVNSAGTGTNQTYGDQLAYVGRLAFSPIHTADWRIHLAGHAQYISHPNDVSGPPNGAAASATRFTVGLSDQAELRVDGTKLINTGNVDARHADNLGAEAAVQYRGLLLQSEYDRFDISRVVSGVSNPHFAGWYVEGSWVLTGEARKYNAANAAFDAPPVRHALGHGGYGAFEVAGRYSTMNLNYDQGALGSAPTASTVRGGNMHIYAAAVNWYPNPYVRFALEGQHVELDRYAPDALTYATPIGAQIGQSYNTVALRSQFGF